MAESSTPQEEHAPTPSGMAPSRDWDPSNDKSASPHRFRSRMRVALVTVVAALYASGLGYFSSHFVPGTTVDGVDAGLMTSAELTEALEARVSSYEQHVTSPGGYDGHVTRDNLALTCDAARVASEAMSRITPALWPLHLLTPQHMLIDAGLSIDEEQLAGIFENSIERFNEGAEQPTNASATFDEEQGAYVATPESTGTALDATAVTKASVVAARELRQEVTLGSDALLQPERTTKDEALQAVIEQANESIGKPLDIVSPEGEVVATVTPEMKREWLSVDGDLNIVIDGSAIYQWVTGNESIYSAGDRDDDEHVWELDALNTAGNTAMAIRDAQDGPVEVVRTLIESKPPVTPGAKELGRHVDVNLTTQFARLYDDKGTVIWDSYLVSGGWDYTMGIMHSTPTGTFHIEAKATNQTLIGADLDGDQKPDYESYVTYWMPFLGNDVGFHDATWRTEFGGDIRSWYGSHGCINLPYAKAEELFGLINVGDMVVVHE